MLPFIAGAHHEIPRPVNDRGSLGRAGAPCVSLADGHTGARGHALAHPPPGHDPQQPLHAPVGKYSLQSHHNPSQPLQTGVRLAS